MSFWRTALVLLGAGCLQAAARSQPPPAPWGPSSMPIVAPSDEGVNPKWHQTVDLQLLLGMQTGFRVGLTVDREEHHAYVAELFGGMIFTGPVSGAAAGAGARIVYFLPASVDGVIKVGPGLHLLYTDGGFSSIQSKGVGFVVPDVTVSWQNNIAPKLGWEIGIDLGVGVGLGGEQSNGDNLEGRVAPLISLFTGWQF